MIKAHLDEMLDTLKTTMESIEVQYEQSNIGWAQYSSEKVLNEIQQELVHGGVELFLRLIRPA